MNRSLLESRYRNPISGALTSVPLMSVLFVALSGLGYPTFAQDISALSPLRAQSVIVMRIEVNGLPDDKVVYLEIMGPDDERYRAIDVVNSGDCAIKGALFSESTPGKRVLIVPIFATSVKHLERIRHPFDKAGMYKLRLTSRKGDLEIPLPADAVLVETEMKFDYPSEADQRYFALAQGNDVRALLNLGDYDRSAVKGDTIIGLGIIAHIIQSTRHQSDPTHGKTAWAVPLRDLALAVPDSSYAPYLAYYASCSYMWKRKSVFIKAEYGFELPDKRVLNLEHYRKARKTLEFATERGDPYIRPFATCFLAGMKVWAADFPGARELIENTGVRSHESAQIAEFARQLDGFLVSAERKVKGQ